MKSILKEAWDLADSKLARARLERLAPPLESDHPGAAGSIREGLDETLTLQGLGIDGTLYKKLRSTNAIENLNSGIATYSKNVKRWQGGLIAGGEWVSEGLGRIDLSIRCRQMCRSLGFPAIGTPCMQTRTSPKPQASSDPSL